MRSGENNEGRKTNIAISLFKILPQMTFKGKKRIDTHIDLHNINQVCNTPKFIIHICMYERNNW